MVAGAGGGFDGVCALPVALRLHELGHTVHLANYSTTPLESLEHVERPLENLVRVDQQSRHPDSGIPFVEGRLARWLSSRKQLEWPVWCLERLGVAPTRQAYEYLREQLGFDTLILVDGGVDALFLGNEHEIDFS